jgi:flagellar basal-body rod protein FlgB
MDLSQIGIFSLAERRLAWVDQRQAVLAQNVANASTPDFQPSDLPSFASTLDQFSTMALATPQPGDLPGAAGGPLQPVQENEAHGPDGNGVALDTQLTRIAGTETTQSLVTSIYKKYMTLFGQALGQGPSA